MKATMVKTMRAAAIDRFGGVDEIKVETVPVPALGEDELLIKVESAGVGVWDPFEREGGFAQMLGGRVKFPYIMGSDGAGTVVAAGERVKRFKEGDRVYAMSVASSKGGFYAEYAVVKEVNASQIPGKLTTLQAGAMPADAITALRGLDDVLGIKSGDSLLIFGASGGIGHLAVQLARRMGARVLAVASGDDGVAMVERLHADKVIDGHKDDIEAAIGEFAPQGLDAVLLTAGGAEAEQVLQFVREGGRVAYPNGVEPEPQPRPGLTVEGYDGTADSQIIAKLNRLIESGPFDVHVDRTFKLDQAAEAHSALERHFLGKLAITP